MVAAFALLPEVYFHYAWFILAATSMVQVLAGASGKSAAQCMDCPHMELLVGKDLICPHFNSCLNCGCLGGFGLTPKPTPQPTPQPTAAPTPLPTPQPTFGCGVELYQHIDYEGLKEYFRQGDDDIQGKGMPDLSTKSMGTKHWGNQVSSMKVDSGCSVILCRDKNYKKCSSSFLGYVKSFRVWRNDDLESFILEKGSCWVVFYEHRDYGGKPLYLKSSQENLKDFVFSDTGGWENEVTSFEIADGCQVKLCKNINHEDCSSPFTSAQTDLGKTWANDKLNSFILESA